MIWCQTGSSNRLLEAVGEHVVGFGLEGADIGAVADIGQWQVDWPRHAALIGEYPAAATVAGIDGRAAGDQSMGGRGAAIQGQRQQLRVDVVLIADLIEEAAIIGIAEVVAAGARLATPVEAKVPRLLGALSVTMVLRTSAVALSPPRDTLAMPPVAVPAFSATVLLISSMDELAPASARLRMAPSVPPAVLPLIVELTMRSGSAPLLRT